MDTAQHRVDQLKDALERDLEQTKHDLPGLEGRDLDQDVSDTVKQAIGDQPIPPKGVPNRHDAPTPHEGVPIRR